jgi:altronate dehydratase small subunit
MHAIHLSPLDNIVVLARRGEAGDSIRYGAAADHALQLATSLGLGHKVACRRIAAGEKILKYGVPIGSATRDIEPGEHVHLHNMKSDYLPTYTLEDGRLFGAAP